MTTARELARAVRECVENRPIDACSDGEIEAGLVLLLEPALAAARAEGYAERKLLAQMIGDWREAARELEWVKCPTPGGDHMNALGTFAPHNCPVCAPIEPEGGE